MNLITAVAVMAAMLTGPFPDHLVTSRDLAASGERSTPHIAQLQQEVQPAPLPPTQESGQRIAAFWIILPN